MPRKLDTPSISAVYGRQKDRYLELVHRFPLRPIRSDAELEDAIRVIDSLLDRDDLTPPEDDYLDVLSDLVEVYEEQAIPIEPLGDAELLRLLMNAKGVTQAKVAREVGIAESTISELLSGKRKLNRKQIGKLARYFRVEPGSFTFGR